MRERDQRDYPRRGDRDRDSRRHDFDDYGQADYSTDYGYDPDRRSGYRAVDEERARRDFGQADYSQDYAYDPETRRGYRRHEGDPDGRYGSQWSYGRDDRGTRDDRGYDRDRESRSWEEDRRHGRHGNRGASDRVIWTVVRQRLDNERGLDASDIDVEVRAAEVTLNGTVRDRDDKRRAEDLAELRDVRHVQNNLRVRHRSWARRFGF